MDQETKIQVEKLENINSGRKVIEQIQEILGNLEPEAHNVTLVTPEIDRLTKILHKTGKKIQAHTTSLGQSNNQIT